LDDRLAAVRQNYANLNGGTPIPAAADSAAGTSVWGKVSYGEFRRDNSVLLSSLAGPLGYDTSYRQTMDGFEIGADRLLSNSPDGSWVLGALVGYDTSNLHFRADANQARYSVWNVGVYASYMSGPWSGDLLIKDDLTKVKFEFPSVPGIEDRNGNSIGAKLTLGRRFASSDISLEPLASLSYLNTSLADLGVPGSNFDFNFGKSFKGTLGVSLSANPDEGAMKFQPFLFAGVGHEFDAKDSITMTSGGTSILIADKPIRTFAISSIGLNVFGESGLSGFVKADGMYANHARSFAFWGGLRFTS
jgi:outer membrane autotransporter protein